MAVSREDIGGEGVVGVVVVEEALEVVRRC